MLREVVKSGEGQVNLNNLLSHGEKADEEARKEMIIKRDCGHHLRIGNLQHAVNSVNCQTRRDLATDFDSLSERGSASCTVTSLLWGHCHA